MKYASLLLLLALAAIASMNMLASTIKNVFSNAAGKLSSATWDLGWHLGNYVEL